MLSGLQYCRLIITFVGHNSDLRRRSGVDIVVDDVVVDAVFAKRGRPY